MNLSLNLVASAQKFPDHAALRMDDQVLTYARLDESTARLAQLMISMGIGPGDRIGLMVPNVPEFGLVFYAALRCGAVVVPAGGVGEIEIRGHNLMKGYWQRPEAAALHRDFVQAAMSNALATPGGATMLGSPVDMSKIITDSYVIAGISDHISAWQACYASGALLGGDREFVLSTSGHIASMVNPPGNPKASFRSGPITGQTADQWLKAASSQKGSWWPHYAQWLAARSGDEKDAPDVLGGTTRPPLDPAPGTYVFES